MVKGDSEHGLAEKHAAPDGTAPRMNEQEVRDRLAEIPGWSLQDGKLFRDVKVKNFREALDLVARIGEVSEAENHHPDVCIHSWNHVSLSLYTHTVQAISENDFIMAAKFSELLPGTE
jgi:4a-hydroxytetrahydrobiopterin dehydratase